MAYLTQVFYIFSCQSVPNSLKPHHCSQVAFCPIFGQDKSEFLYISACTYTLKGTILWCSLEPLSNQSSFAFHSKKSDSQTAPACDFSGHFSHWNDQSPSERWRKKLFIPFHVFLPNLWQHKTKNIDPMDSSL